MLHDAQCRKIASESYLISFVAVHCAVRFSIELSLKIIFELVYSRQFSETECMIFALELLPFVSVATIYC